MGLAAGLEMRPINQEACFTGFVTTYRLSGFLCSFLPTGVSNSLQNEVSTMTSPFSKVRFALVFLFVLLALSFASAQAVRDGGPDTLSRGPDGKGSQSGEVFAARPTGGAVTTGNGINYNGGPVLKHNP